MLIDNDGLTCEKLSFELSDNKNYPPNGNPKCDLQVNEFSGKCCDSNVKVEDVEQKIKPPSPAPSLFPKGEEPVCPVCFGGERPSKWWVPTATIIIDENGKFTCGDLDEYGKSGNIPDRLCYAMQLARQEVCGCLPVAPTSSPVVDSEEGRTTSLPTEQPTSLPSLIPTINPTLNPTIYPTSLPTVSPSALPTLAPTHAPSANPTSAPSPAPSSLPSRNPSQFPSSLHPTMLPSEMPTTSAPVSSSPTISPSITPFTSLPTKSPEFLDMESGDEENADSIVVELPLVYDGGSSERGDIKGDYLSRGDRYRGNLRHLRKVKGR